MSQYFRPEQGRLERIDTVPHAQSDRTYVRGTNYFGIERTRDPDRIRLDDNSGRSPSPNAPKAPSELGTMTPLDKMNRLREMLSSGKVSNRMRAEESDNKE